MIIEGRLSLSLSYTYNYTLYGETYPHQKTAFAHPFRCESQKRPYCRRFCLTAVLRRLRGASLQPHPRTPWICSTLGFCNVRVSAVGYENLLEVAPLAQGNEMGNVDLLGANKTTSPGRPATRSSLVAV
jgi:hypothetical protein